LTERSDAERADAESDFPDNPETVVTAFPLILDQDQPNRNAPTVILVVESGQITEDAKNADDEERMDQDRCREVVYQSTRIQPQVLNPSPIRPAWVYAPRKSSVRNDANARL
jgi:hypothetical protein